jgi:enamine deaminase RidA (YjgF/YER057c/UK114 family)
METKEKSTRRKAIKGLLATAALGLGITKVNAAEKKSQPLKKVAANITNSDNVPLFSGHTTYGNVVFIAGKGYHEEGDIAKHTDEVLKTLEKELIKAGSSMDKVLKVNVYLHDLNDYKGMNEVYRGRFGDNPPVRTTVATFGGVPGESLVEIDCIAYKD